MSIADMAVGLNEGQRAMARIIEQEFRAAGFDDTTIAAAIVNAKAESNLDPTAAGDKGQSIGLFQLYAKGAGAGMSVAQRQDPVQNTRRIIQEVKSNWGKRLRAYTPTTKGLPSEVAEAVAIFAEDIERPADKVLARSYRGAMALAMFPGGIGEMEELFLSPIQPLLGLKRDPNYYMKVVLSLGALAVGGAIFYVSVRRATRRD